MKRCQKCGEVKPLEDFYPRKSSQDGRRSDCKACEATQAHKYYKATATARREYSRHWRETHPDEARDYDRRRHIAKRETILGRMRERQRDYRADLRAAVFTHYGTVCACCGTAKRLSIDHVSGDGAEHRERLYGRRNGGGVQFWRWLIKQGFPQGYQTLCLPCNQSKGNGKRCKITH